MRMSIQPSAANSHTRESLFAAIFVVFMLVGYFGLITLNGAEGETMSGKNGYTLTLQLGQVVSIENNGAPLRVLVTQEETSADPITILKNETDVLSNAAGSLTAKMVSTRDTPFSVVFNDRELLKSARTEAGNQEILILAGESRNTIQVSEPLLIVVSSQKPFDAQAFVPTDLGFLAFVQRLCPFGISAWLVSGFLLLGITGLRRYQSQ